jgi:hypothetical protein
VPDRHAIQTGRLDFAPVDRAPDIARGLLEGCLNSFAPNVNAFADKRRPEVHRQFTYKVLIGIRLCASQQVVDVNDG